METIFKDIQAAIRTNVPEVKWLDIDEGQLTAFGENAPVDYPCVLIGFPQAQYQNIGGGQQIAEVTVQIKVAFRVYERLNDSVATNYRTQAFAHFTVLRNIMRAVHLLGGAHYNSLQRRSWVKEPEADPKIYTLTYVTMVKDTDIGRKQNQETLEEPNLKVTATFN